MLYHAYDRDEDAPALSGLVPGAEPEDEEAAKPAFDTNGFEIVAEEPEEEDEADEVEAAGDKPSIDVTVRHRSHDPVRAYLREIGKVSLLTAEMEISLAKRIERGDPEARRQLIEANLRLVVSIAKRYV